MPTCVPRGYSPAEILTAAINAQGPGSVPFPFSSATSGSLSSRALLNDWSPNPRPALQTITSSVPYLATTRSNARLRSFKSDKSTFTKIKCSMSSSPEYLGQRHRERRPVGQSARGSDPLSDEFLDDKLSFCLITVKNRYDGAFGG